MKKTFETPRTNIITCEMTGTILTDSIVNMQIGGSEGGSSFS